MKLHSMTARHRHRLNLKAPIGGCHPSLQTLWLRYEARSHASFQKIVIGILSHLNGDRE